MGDRESPRDAESPIADSPEPIAWETNLRFRRMLKGLRGEPVRPASARQVRRREQQSQGEPPVLAERAARV